MDTATFTPLDWARTYHAKGVGFAPVPLWTPDVCTAGRCKIAQRQGECHSPGKHPRVKWKNLERVTRSDVEKWWGQWPDAGVGLLTGARSGFDVIDVDPKNGGDLNAVLELDGVNQATVRTGSGGWHVYLRHPGVDTSNGLADVLNLPGVDYRGDGGLVVAPPSGHTSGNAYALADGADLRNLPPMPAWLVDAARHRADEEARAKVEAQAVRERMAAGERPEVGTDGHSRYGAAVLQNAVDAILAAEPGTPGRGRHDTVLARARTVGGFIASGHIDQARAELALLSAAVTVAGEGREGEMRQTIADGIAHGVTQPLVPDERPPLHVMDASAEPPPDHDQPHDAPETLVERFPDVDWSAVWNDDLDQPDWIVEGLLETRRAAAVYAASGHGKSLFTLEMGACIATGTDFADLRVPKARDVLYVDAENDLGDIIDRLKTFGFTPEDLGRLHYKSFPDLDPLDVEAGGQQLLTLAKAHDAALVIIDTVARTVAGPENDADTYRNLARVTGKLLKAAGIACWRIDHAGKDASGGPRGSKAKTDDVDVVWELIRDRDQAWTLRTGTATLKKRSRHGLTSLQVARLDPDGLLTGRETSDTVTTVRDEVADVVAELDRLEAPSDWGRRKAAAALREAGHAIRNEVVAEAVRVRKGRPEPVRTLDLPGTGLRTGVDEPPEAVRDRSGTATDRETGTPEVDRSAPVPVSKDTGPGDRTTVRPGIDMPAEEWPL